MQQSLFDIIQHACHKICMPISSAQQSLIRSDFSEAVWQLTLPFFLGQRHDSFIECLRQYGQKNHIDLPANIMIHTHTLAHKMENAVKGHAQIKNIIAVVSGKGGVGKSTVSLNVATALAQQGGRVGLLDADIHGPSQPTMLGVSEAMRAAKGGRLTPVMQHGLETASISYFMTKDDPVIWRGPMVSRALEQLVHDVAWSELDYLLIDMPPGTGDIALTLTRKIPVAGALVVTTPQDVARIDALKSAQMLQKTHVPILGVVENMSQYHCPACGHESAIFGSGGGERLAKDIMVPILGDVPLIAAIQLSADSGRPIVLDNEQIAKRYDTIASNLTIQLANRPIDVMRT